MPASLLHSRDAAVTPPAADSSRLLTSGIAPSLVRRMACMLYEGVLLFGVLWAAGMVYGVLTQQRRALVGSTGLQAFVAVVLAAYFVYFWSRSGQTLAMLTWHIKLVTVDGARVTPLRALCRHILAWLWFVPALVTLHFAGVRGGLPTFWAIALGMAAYAALTLLRPDRQYWHDAVCRTRLISTRPPAQPLSKSA